MSTYWGYVCLSHDPPLASEHWFNHGADTLSEVFARERRGEWPNEQHITTWDEPRAVVHRGYVTTAPIDWLREHPRCEVALQNEYGDVQAITEPAVS